MIVSVIKRGAMMCGALLSLLPTSIHDESAGNACDRTAWYYLNILQRALPSQLNAVVFYCKRASEADPSNPRYHYQSGRAFYRKTDYASAWLEYKTSAELGHAPAAGAFAHITDEGYGAPADPGKAADLILAALELGTAADRADNMRRLFNEDWTAEFWEELRKRLVKTGHLPAALQPASKADIKAALDAIADK